MGFHEQYKSKLVSSTDAALLIRNNCKLALGMGVSQPAALMKALAARVKDGDLTHLPVYYMHASDAAMKSLLVPELMDVVRPHPLFMSHCDRELANKGFEVDRKFVDYIPCTFHQAGKLLTEEIGVDCFIVTVSPMNSAGYFSMGTNADYGVTVVDHCSKIIVEVNKNMPFVQGDHLIHISNVRAIIESDEPLMVHPSRNITKKDRMIGEVIAEYINDGDTIQLGVGGVPGAVANALLGKNDLGMHTELMSPSMRMLIENGNITGKKKTLLPKKHVFTLALGDQDMYDYMGTNPAIIGMPVSFVNSPAVIAQNNSMKSINAAIEVDLSGQINSEAMGGRHWSGPGGQLDFVRGAYASKGGMSFVALYSTAKNDTISRIVLKLNGAVTNPRIDAHIVVTEYGMVNLKGKSLCQRARSLISIAHPKFRDQLYEEAIKGGIFYH